MWLGFWWSGSLVEAKWCHYVMVVAVILFKLVLASILDICKHCYAINRHMVTALVSYTRHTWLSFWWSESLVESKWCHYIMVEAAIVFKLLPVSILDIYKVCEYIDMLSIGHMVVALVSYTHSTWLIASQSRLQSKTRSQIVVNGWRGPRIPIHAILQAPMCV